MPTGSVEPTWSSRSPLEPRADLRRRSSTRGASSNLRRPLRRAEDRRFGLDCSGSHPDEARWPERCLHARSDARRKPGPRRLRIMGQRHAKRLPRCMKPIRPAELVQTETLFVTRSRLGRQALHELRPAAKWTGPSARRERAPSPQASSYKLIAEVPFRSRASKSMAGRSSGPSSRTNAEIVTCASSSCRRSGPSSTATSNAPKPRARYEFYGVEIFRPASDPSSSASTPSPIASITQGLTKHLAISPQPSTSR